MDTASCLRLARTVYIKNRVYRVGQGRIITPYMTVSGLFSSTFWEQEFDKVRKSSRTVKLFEQFDVQFRKWRILLVSMVILDQNMLVLAYMCIIYYQGWVIRRRRIIRRIVFITYLTVFFKLLRIIRFWALHEFCSHKPPRAPQKHSQAL